MTGDDPGWHDIVGMAAILCKPDWSQVSKFETLIYPKDKDAFTLVADRLPHIDIKELEEASMMFEVLDKFEEWIIKSMGLRADDPLAVADALSEVIMCGHAFVNDYSFLRMAYGDENKDWNFSTQMFDLTTVSHFYFQWRKKNGDNTPSSLSLKAIAHGVGVRPDDDLSISLENADVTRKCFHKIEQTLMQAKIED
jgi:DNA polymerase-3 subunit epsilon